MEGIPDKSWYRCAKCRHSMLISSGDLKKDIAGQEKKIELKDCISYSPDKVFDVGQKIMHHEWNDVGEVITKEITSSGAHAVIVAFEKLGERRLIENVKTMEKTPMAPSHTQPAGGSDTQSPDQKSDAGSEGPPSSTNPLGGDKSW